MKTTAISKQRTQGQLQVREMQGKRGRNGGGLDGKKGLDLPSGKYTTTKTLLHHKENKSITRLFEFRGTNCVI